MGQVKRKRLFVVEITVSPEIKDWNDKHVQLMVGQALERERERSDRWRDYVDKTRVMQMKRWQHGQRLKIKALRARLKD